MITINKFIKSFKYAICGFFTALRTERNLKIHICMMFLVILCGIIFNITKVEWLICIILFGLVISAELFNTAIEKIVDVILPNKDDRAKKIKDISASAVLVVAIMSAIIGFWIFIPKIFNK